MKKSLMLMLSLLLIFCGSTQIFALPVVTTEGDENPFIVRHQSIEVDVYNHLIRTTVTQLVVNAGEKDIPCNFDLYLPKGAHASMLEAEVDGKKYVGRIERKAVARAIVEESKEERKVAALAEERNGVLHIEFSLVRAACEILFKVSYIEEAEYNNGVFDYWFGIEKFNKELKFPDTFSMNVSFKCTTGLKSVTSSSHTLIGKISGNTAGFSVEDIGNIKEDFHMSYSLDLKPGEPNLMLLNRKNEDPYFCMLSLPPDAPTEDTTRSIIFILDKSGSMQGDKFALAVSSLIGFIDKLRPNDIFNVFIFDSSYSYCSPLPFKADASGKENAKKFIGKFNAVGGTYILGPTVDALTQLKYDQMNPTAIVLLTDGQGSTSAPDFIKEIDTRFQFKVPLFVFAIGMDLNIPLLRSLARHSGGAFAQVTKSEEIATSLAEIRGRFDNICGFNLNLTTKNRTGYFRVPKRLSHLYKGELIKVMGRFDANKNVSLSISANTTAGKWASTLDFTTIDNREDCPFLDQGWGIKRIEELLDDDSNFGSNAERTEEIIALSQKYLISTRFTSLVFSELSEKRQNELSDEGDVEFEEMKGLVTGGIGSSTGGSFGGKRRSRKKSPGNDKDVDSLAKVIKPIPWYDDTNQLLDVHGKPIANQVIGHSMITYVLRNAQDETSKSRRQKSAMWLAVHSKEGEISSDLLEQVMATCALAGAKGIAEGIDEIVAAAINIIAARDFSIELKDKGNEYVLAVAFFFSSLMDAGKTFPQTQKNTLKAEVLKIFGSCDFSTVPYGKTYDEIQSWTSFAPIAANLSTLLSIEIDSAKLSLAAKITNVQSIAIPNVILWLSWKNLIANGKVKTITAHLRYLGNSDLSNNAEPQSLFLKALCPRIMGIIRL